MLEKVRQRLGVRNIVDRHEIQVCLGFHGGPEHVSPNSPKSVDRDFCCHSNVPPDSAFLYVCVPRSSSRSLFEHTELCSLNQAGAILSGRRLGNNFCELGNGKRENRRARTGGRYDACLAWRSHRLHKGVLVVEACRTVSMRKECNGCRGFLCFGAGPATGPCRGCPVTVAACSGRGFTSVQLPMPGWVAPPPNARSPRDCLSQYGLGLESAPQFSTAGCRVRPRVRRISATRHSSFRLVPPLQGGQDRFSCLLSAFCLRNRKSQIANRKSQLP